MLCGRLRLLVLIFVVVCAYTMAATDSVPLLPDASPDTGDQTVKVNVGGERVAMDRLGPIIGK